MNSIIFVLAHPGETMAQRERPKTLERAVRTTLQNYGVAAIIAVICLILLPGWLLWSLLYIGGVLFLASVIAPYIDDWRPRARVPPQGKAVFISGKSPYPVLLFIYFK